MNDFSWLRKSERFNMMQEEKFDRLVSDIKEQIPDIADRKPLVFLGEGNYKVAWEIDECKVLQLFADSEHILNEYSVVQEIWENKHPWLYHEPRVFKKGTVNTYIGWAIMEQFRVLKPETISLELDEKLEQLTSTIEVVCEDNVDCFGKELPISLKSIPSKMTLNFYNSLKSHIDSTLDISSKRLGFKNEKALYAEYRCFYNLLKLNDDWLHKVIFDTIYKSVTGRVGDLHPENLGFRSNGEPLFFDW